MAETRKAKQQRGQMSYLAAEKQRQRGKPEEDSQYPEFHLDCHGCNASLKTSNCEAGISFLRQHLNHATTFEVNQRPNAVIYDRELVLEQLASFGKYLVQRYGTKDVVVKQARVTYQAVGNGIDIEGALRRLLEFLVSSDDFCKFWCQSIIKQDHRFCKRAAKKLLGANTQAKEETA